VRTVCRQRQPSLIVERCAAGYNGLMTLRCACALWYVLSQHHDIGNRILCGRPACPPKRARGRRKSAGGTHLLASRFKTPSSHGIAGRRRGYAPPFVLKGAGAAGASNVGRVVRPRASSRGRRKCPTSESSKVVAAGRRRWCGRWPRRLSVSVDPNGSHNARARTPPMEHLGSKGQ